MDSTDDLRSRQLGYELFARLYRDGLTEELADYVRSLPDFSESIGIWRASVPGGGDGDERRRLDFDGAAADYQHIFGFNVFPFAGVFIDETAQVGGETTRRVIDLYHDAGFAFDQTGESADHIGVELDFLAHLIERELSTADPAEAAEARRTAGHFLESHLMMWLPLFTDALVREKHPFFRSLADYTLTSVSDHVRVLGDSGVEFDGEFPLLPEPPPVLDNPKTGLRDIARFLLVPAYSGIYLSRDDIREMSRRENLPAGFGSRRVMLTNLLRSASDYEGFGSIVDELQVRVDGSRRVWYRSADDSDVWRPISATWNKRLDRTTAMLSELRDAWERLSEAE